MVTDENPTAEVIARMIYEFVAGKGYPVTGVTLWETETSHASYRPGS
jgi:6-pyruvoyltetrahydropterin/6-carboxytetrahydropterin synthase